MSPVRWCTLVESSTASYCSGRYSTANGTHLRQLQGDRACAVARKLTRKGWPLAANPWRALRKCNVARMLTLPIAHPLTPFGYWIPDSGVKPRARYGAIRNCAILSSSCEGRSCRRCWRQGSETPLEQRLDRIPAQRAERWLSGLVERATICM